MSPDQGGVYIASKTKHAHRWRDLRSSGVPIISTWIDEAGEGETRDYGDLWLRCITEASVARVCVVYVEPGEVLKGALAEVGASLAAGASVYWVGPVGSYTVTRHPAVTLCDTIDEAMVLAREG